MMLYLLILFVQKYAKTLLASGRSMDKIGVGGWEQGNDSIYE